jgi:hypothetical protein
MSNEIKRHLGLILSVVVFLGYEISQYLLPYKVLYNLEVLLAPNKAAINFFNVIFSIVFLLIIQKNTDGKPYVYLKLKKLFLPTTLFALSNNLLEGETYAQFVDFPSISLGSWLIVVASVCFAIAVVQGLTYGLYLSIKAVPPPENNAPASPLPNWVQYLWQRKLRVVAFTIISLVVLAGTIGLSELIIGSAASNGDSLSGAPSWLPRILLPVAIVSITGFLVWLFGFFLPERSKNRKHINLKSKHLDDYEVDEEVTEKTAKPTIFESVKTILQKFSHIVLVLAVIYIFASSSDPASSSQNSNFKMSAVAEKIAGFFKGMFNFNDNDNETDLLDLFNGATDANPLYKILLWIFSIIALFFLIALILELGSLLLDVVRFKKIRISIDLLGNQNY